MISAYVCQTCSGESAGARSSRSVTDRAAVAEKSRRSHRGGWKAIVPDAIANRPEAQAELDEFWQIAEEKYAKLRDWKFTPYPADWKQHGKAAGMIRNAEMVRAADWVVAFWDGKSKGTKNTIDTALRLGKRLEVHFP